MWSVSVCIHCSSVFKTSAFLWKPAGTHVFNMALSPKWYQFLVGVFASLGSLLYGYDLGVIAQVIASQSFNLRFNPTDNEE